MDKYINMRFPLIFMGCLVALSFLVALSLGSMEMIAAILFFNLAYLILAFFTWTIINSFIRPNKLVYSVLKYFIGLGILNISIYFMTGDYPTGVLIGIGNKEISLGISLGLHIVYSLAYTIAELDKWKKFTYWQADATL